MNHAEEISLKFYHYVCNIIGSEDVVELRRNIFKVMDFVLKDTYRVTYISSGSKAEGLDIRGSDYDQMVVYEGFRVYENMNNERDAEVIVPLLMETNDSKPGFTKLKLYNKTQKNMISINHWLETLGQETFISSKLFREFLLYPGVVNHGPCISLPVDLYDNACCFRSKQWITSAQQWIYRPRSTWPDHKLVTSIVQYGVLFVPIGCKSSQSEDLEWRISFSMAERQLIYSFTHTQLLCYGLLKVILKDIIKPKCGDLICSYFLKTIMFWLCEETNPLDWKPRKITLCFMDCLRRLIYCVEYKICLHYFIPDNNLFENRYDDDQKAVLLETLRIIYSSPSTSIFNTSTFQEYKLNSINSRVLELKTSEMSCLCHLNLHMKSIYRENVNYLKRAIMLCTEFSNKKLSQYVLSLASNRYIQYCNLLNLTSSNKYFYRQNNITLGSFRIGLFTDTLCSWLLLASFMYQCKRFKECLYIINFCLSKCTPDVIFLSISNSLKDHTVFQRMKQAVGLLLTCKHFIIQYSVFNYPFNLLPRELITLSQNTEIIMIPPVVYCNVLLCLCFHHLRDDGGKQNALHDLELTIREMYFIQEDFEVSNECLDIIKSKL